MVFGATRVGGKVKGAPNMGEVAFQRRNAANDGGRLRVEKPQWSNSELLSLATPTVVFRCQPIPFNLFVLMVPSIHDESARIANTLFNVETTNIVSCSGLNGALF